MKVYGLNGKWHKLRVEVARRDLVVRFRPGYLAERVSTEEGRSLLGGCSR